MTDVQITPADRKAAEAFNDEAVTVLLYDNEVEVLAEHFAAHAARAVHAERKRCVEELRSEAAAIYAKAAGINGNLQLRLDIEAKAWGYNKAADQLQKGAG